ncbi:DNA polymerase III subunit delta [Legionella feeleii]|uniref:DNA polymerase III subunit delta n=1 Tax=Legionella feeleii TaxID=453 RepID=A0A0W0TIN1_9GAMM|nr:DNA polymerase III subunit delta [Legionella feeleii]KTC95489.1 DNA polymerase III, delta subunit [Legionella feeleii]
MLIKQQALTSHLAKKISGLYLVIGQDCFLLNSTADSIKQAWCPQNKDDYEETTLPINNPTDWKQLDEEANSYSLFAHKVLIDVRYEKKTLDPAGKEFLSNYIQNMNPRCLILIRAPNLPLKQLQWLTSHDNAHIVQVFSFDNSEMQHWIKQRLQANGLTFDQQIPSLIHQYTQGNMLACAQVITKLQLIAEQNCVLTSEIVREQLVDQCDYQLFDLADACLSCSAERALQILRHAYNTKTEPTLILWLLTQEIRQLIQLIELVDQSVPFNTACNQLKIWSQRSRLYQTALRQASLDNLQSLLQFCKLTDERIKSNQSGQIWHALELITLSLCLGKQVGCCA